MTNILLDTIETPTHIPITRDSISDVLNLAADTIQNELDLGDRDGDLMNLLVNAAMTLLDDPFAGLEDVANRCYGEELKTVRGWIS
ncbi:hypothetical protein ACIRBX_12050 [Kitasatospora sp. NPDC096147]|uniref:hypothetical protein n=1 Tax=Kitasatospora sp. NPDC096147 TaxID=3364093 RepID=UPI0038120E5F